MLCMRRDRLFVRCVDERGISAVSGPCGGVVGVGKGGFRLLHMWF
jgi:hypothetical protein